MVQKKPSILQSPALKIVLGIILALLLFLLFLPQLTSTTWISAKLKNVINNKAPGKLEFSQMNLSWADGLEIQDLQYLDENLGISFTVDEITTTKGLFSLATNYKNTGAIRLKSPQAKVYIKQDPVAPSPEPPANAGTRATAPAIDNAATPDISKKNEPFQSLSFPPFNIQIEVTDGSLLAIESDNSEKSIIKNLNLQLKLDGSSGSMDYQLSFDNGQAAGKVIGAGDLLLPQGTTPNLNSLQSNAHLEITDWQMADLLNLAAARTNAPTGEGVINGALQLTGKGISAISLNGNLTGREIKLHGGSLQSDTPELDEFSIDLNVELKDKIISVDTLQVTSPFVTATVTGNTKEKILQALKAEAKVDLPEIFSQFPTTLNLKKGMQLSEGMIDIDADLNTIENDTLFKANAHLEHLVGFLGKKNISLTQPVNIALAGKNGADSINIDKLEIVSSFLTAKGSGNSDNMQLNVTANIGDALKEMAKFIDLGGIQSHGKLNLDLTIINDSKVRKQLAGNLKVDGFKLARDKVQISPEEQLSVAFKSNIQLEDDSTVKEIGATSLQFSSWLGQGILTVDGIVPPNDNTPAVINKGLLNNTFDLKHVTSLLHSLEALPKEQQLSGPLKLTANISGENTDRPDIDLVVDISPFTLANGTKTFTEDNFRLKLAALADLKEKNYTIKNFGLSSKSAVLAAKGSLVSKNNEQIVTSTGNSILNLKVLSQQLQSYLDLELEMSGTSDNPFQLTTKTKDGQWSETGKLTELSTSFHADTITGYGLIIESLDMPIQLKQSIGEVDFKAKVNRGVMTLKPKIDFSGESPVASLPENSAILKEVGLTADMSNDLLAKINPLFKGVSSSSGTINLEMTHMSWPLGKEQKKDVTFAGSFTFNEVKLQAGALLSPLLAIMKTEDNSITLDDKPMTFVGENERVTCSPLVAIVNGHSLILEGSVGFDQSLDYMAKIPVTRKMVSSKLYKYLEGAYISVPIAGTVSKPKVSKSFVKKALGDLVIKAGKKQLGDQAGKLLQDLFN